MRTILVIGWLLPFLAVRASGEEALTIKGHIADAQGNPVAGAAIDFFWSANGPVMDEAGQPLKLDNEEAITAYRGRFGQMAPILKATSAADGRFSIQRRGEFYTLMVMDAQRAQGGLVLIPKKYDGSEIEVPLQPLTRVTGILAGPEPGRRPAEATVVVEVPEDPMRPLAMSRLVIGDTRDAKFLMSLPPGRYVLRAHDGDFKNELTKEFELNGDDADADLGVLALSSALPNINDRVKQSQESGAMGDYKKRYGQKLPDWHIVDARGVSKNLRIGDLKGRWVLINFWALNCGHCLKADLPRLAKFYHDHQNQRERFEILAICVDCNGKLKSVAEVDRELEPIVKYVWGEKPLPFPILLDPSMTTLERFGVPGYETILIDPEGRLVEGDETTLAEKLSAKKK